MFVKFFSSKRFYSYLAIPFMLFLITATTLVHAEIDKDSIKPAKNNTEEAREDSKDSQDSQPVDAESHEDLHQRLEKESRENLKEISRLMEQVQNSLAKKNTGAATQKQEKDVIQKIDGLIKKISKGCGKPSCSSCSSGKSGKGSKPKLIEKKSKGNKPGQKKNQKDVAKKEKMKPGQKKKGKSQKKEPTGKPEDPGKTRNDQVADGKLPDSKLSALMKKLMGKAQWGRLPNKLREEIGSSSQKEFPREYREIIAQYYKRMSEVLGTE